MVICVTTVQDDMRSRRSPDECIVNTPTAVPAVVEKGIGASDNNQETHTRTARRSHEEYWEEGMHWHVNI